MPASGQLPRRVKYPHIPVFASALQTLAADGAVEIDFDGETTITKGSAAAVTVAAPGAKNIGRTRKITTGSDFAHVVTFTGSTLKDGTTGAKITWTTVAFIGCSLEIYAITATQWVVLSKNLGTVA